MSNALFCTEIRRNFIMMQLISYCSKTKEAEQFYPQCNRNTTPILFGEKNPFILKQHILKKFNIASSAKQIK